MILAIDIGNTTVALGGIRDGRVCFVAHMDTVRTRTAAEYRAEMEKVFSHRRHPEKPIRFEGAVLTSVVPQITGALAECARHYTGKKPVIVSPDIRTGLTMGVPDPHAVGKDRLVDAAYAAANFPLPVVTVDLGTATTFNVVDENKVFRGGVICPGLSTGLRALGERCAQLPQVHLSSPKSAIGVDTEKCMLSGSVLGTAVLLVSKRNGDASYQDLVAKGYLTEAILNYICLLGWSPKGEYAEQEIFSLPELVKV